jgi:hypothetical protein
MAGQRIRFSAGPYRTSFAAVMHRPLAPVSAGAAGLSWANAQNEKATAKISRAFFIRFLLLLEGLRE